jgi:hypothetical protein
MILEELSSVYPNHLTIIFGTRPSTISKRQLGGGNREVPFPGVFLRDFQNQPSSKSSTERKPSPGLLAKYQFLTPGLITIIIIVFGFLIPLLYFVISALASIKSPLRSDNSKPVTAEKKVQ